MRNLVSCVSSWVATLSKSVLAATLAVSVVMVSDASAAAKKAAIVVDANTGKVLYGSNADAPRHPASLTKMMTLYMVFEAMAAGKINRSLRSGFQIRSFDGADQTRRKSWDIHYC